MAPHRPRRHALWRWPRIIQKLACSSALASGWSGRTMCVSGSFAVCTALMLLSFWCQLAEAQAHSFLRPVWLLVLPPFLFTWHPWPLFLFGNTCHRILLFQFYPLWAYVKILIYLLCNRKFLEVRCPAPLFLVRPLFLVYAIARCRKEQWRVSIWAGEVN